MPPYKQFVCDWSVGTAIARTEPTSGHSFGGTFHTIGMLLLSVWLSVVVVLHLSYLHNLLPGTCESPTTAYREQQFPSREVMMQRYRLRSPCVAPSVSRAGRPLVPQNEVTVATATTISCRSSLTTSTCCWAGSVTKRAVTRQRREVTPPLLFYPSKCDQI